MHFLEKCKKLKMKGSHKNNIWSLPLRGMEGDKILTAIKLEGGGGGKALMAMPLRKYLLLFLRLPEVTCRPEKRIFL